MTDATNFRPCSDIETRQARWVAIKYDEQLGVFNAVEIASAFANRYADEVKPMMLD